ncbi:hypothetical protein LINPERPRIM_LOCUS24165 [Linum perenne]
MTTSKRRSIQVGSEMSWSFTPDIRDITLFWCDIAVQDKRLSFVAFQDWVGEYPDSVYWVVEDDGVHKMYNDTDPVIVSFRGSLERIECCFSSERSN